MFHYPEARRDETAVENFFGTTVTDPYRWLEDPDSPETARFVEEQNAITKPYLESCPVRSHIKNRLTQLWNYPKYSCPYRHGNKYYFYQNTGLQNHNVMYMQDTLYSEPQVFLDPNTFSKDGTVSLSRTRFSDNGNILSYGVSRSGSDWFTIRFKEVSTGKVFPEELKYVKYSRMTWTHDNKGIFYAKYPGKIKKPDGTEVLCNEHQKLFYHRVGTSQDKDVMCVEFPHEPLWRIGAEVSDCGRWLVVTPQQDCSLNMILVCDLHNLPNGQITGPLNLYHVVGKMEADYEYITNDGADLIFRTSRGAPNYRLIKINILNPAPENWKALIQGHPRNVLDWAAPIRNDKLVLCYIYDVKSMLQLCDMRTGQWLYTFPLDVGTITGFSGKKKNTEMFYQFTSFLNPGIIYHCDLTQNTFQPTVYREITLKDFNPTAYETQQVVYTSWDGTGVPMFIVYRRGIILNKTRPCLLYGYGGFNVSIQPTFCVVRLVFMQHFDGVLAIPNIRGGGEYGEAWHNAGRLYFKQNTFNDFHAAAEFLVAQGYTCKEKLIIQGGSNGGLLIAACINQRPDLYGAALCQVGVLDMLRYHKFTIGHAWVSDYGNPEDPREFPFLFAYSPLHNIRPPDEQRMQYPPTLLLTADHDDRVMPLHSLKFIAALQHAVRGNHRQTNPLLIRVETKAGHGGGKPTSKLIDENTDMLCFVVQSLGLEFYK
ncbi:hypothetical protein R5R35_009893 [Gryllus longicercus]|uniref:Prolyl endopeptidase n=1 Tax=Gryllus longicercus TaxID=2509291 RepID=A0AAN9VUZ7_9ORTH